MVTREGIERHLAALKEDYAKAIQAANQAQLILGAIRFGEQLLKEEDDALSKPRPDAGLLRQGRPSVGLSPVGARDTEPQASPHQESLTTERALVSDEEWR